MLILASASPRRKEILSYFSIKFKTVASHFDEKKIIFLKDPKSYAIEIAENKARALKEQYFNEIILTADTVCFANNKIYTKPNNEKDAFQMLNELSNTWHSVFTAICIKHKDKIFSDIEETKILFHSLTKSQIKKYHSSFYYQDKAAGYAIQKAGSIIIKNMVGCYYNVMGMPINTLKNSLLKVGIDLWDYLKPS